MQMFELLRKHLDGCGIAVIKKAPIFNTKNVTVLFLVCVLTIVTALLLTEVDTFDERTDTLFRTSSLIVCGIFYAIIVWKTPKLFEFINRLSDIVSESE